MTPSKRSECCEKCDIVLGQCVGCNDDNCHTEPKGEVCEKDWCHHEKCGAVSVIPSKRSGNPLTEDCFINRFSSRVCEVGTKCCTKRHTEPKGEGRRYSVTGHDDEKAPSPESEGCQPEKLEDICFKCGKDVSTHTPTENAPFPRPPYNQASVEKARSAIQENARLMAETKAEGWEKEIWTWATQEFPHTHADKFERLIEVVRSLLSSQAHSLRESLIKEVEGMKGWQNCLEHDAKTNMECIYCVERVSHNAALTDLIEAIKRKV